MKVAKNTKGRDFIVGDLHGCFDLLWEKLNHVGFSARKGDRLFSVGDLIDRGKQNLECLDLLLEPWFYAVRGNHEDMMIGGVRVGSGKMLHWYQNGGAWAGKVDNSVLELACERIERHMPYTIELETDKGMVGITHAEPMGNIWSDELDEYTKQMIVWGRNWINKTHDMSVTNMYKTFHGHTPTQVVKQLGNVHFIDTGAVFNEPYGNLTLMEIT